MKIKHGDETFAKKIGEALSDFYNKYSLAKKKGKTDLLCEKFSKQVELAVQDYHLSKIRHER